MSKLVLSKKMIVSCFLASCLEIYDFVIFAFLTPLLQKNYFTFLDKETILIVSYILFAIGFIFRPIGSLIFGYVGDVFGRRKALVSSISLMGSCSLIMCFLPTYEILGLVSCYIIVLVRIIQGISVGGEFTGALVFAIEHTDKRQAGLIGGILAGGGAGGMLLATLVSNILQNPWFPEYSWRFAFLLGFGLSIIGYFIRQKLTETPVFQNLESARNKVPLVEGIKKFKLKCITTTLIAAANGACMYFAVVFLPNHLKQLTNIETKWMPLLMTSLVLMGTPVAGTFSDKMNRPLMLIISSILMVFYLPFMLNSVVNLGESFIVVCFVIYGLIFSVMASTINTYAIEIFLPPYRMSCSSFFYSLGMGLIGGTVPTVAALIVRWFGSNPIYISVYISIICALAAGSSLLVVLTENKQKALHIS